MSGTQPPFAFLNTALSFDERVEDLVARLTLDEKAAQMLHEAPAISRLGIPAYNWWNECLHGVARAGLATVFPQAIGLAAMWNVDRVHQVAVAVSDEARAKHHEYLRHQDRGMYKGLTFWTPNINIFRDPRWGRGHETFGECPFLTGRLGVALCKGLQGDHPRYLKVVATPKHYAVHSGPEALRHSFDAQVSAKDLRETYLPAFFDCVTDGRAQSVMAAYNRTNGEPCCGSPTLLKHILRDEWHFDGYVVSDCWAIKDFHEGHLVTKTWEESAAVAVKAGCDLNCGCAYEHIPSAVKQGLLAEADIDICVKRLFRARMQLGMFDPPDGNPWAQIPYEVNDCAQHRQLARTTARESLVLLKNDGPVLPLSKDLKNIAVIGPNAYDPQVLLANYFGTPSKTVTPLDGIRAAVSARTKVWYAPGCKLQGLKTDGLGRAGNLSEAVSVAERSDAVVLFMGLSAEIEGEQGDAGNSEASGDKTGLELTGLQQRLMQEIVALGKPTVLVLIAGSALDTTWAQEHVGAILQAWYPGEEAGNAIADVLFGDHAPGGRLPVTFPGSTAHLPDISDYRMQGRTYRYLDLERPPLYPFGYGLSYTRFAYSDIAVSRERFDMTDGGTLPQCEVSATVTNVGTRTGDEVAQLYLKDLAASVTVPHHQLRGFDRLTLGPGESRRVTFKLSARDLSLIDARGNRILEPGRFRATIGGSQPDARSVELTGQTPLAIEFEVVGARVRLPY
ncbi:MAG: glycoside hydrolase family 3 C-terminal domain-containing protein [Deltaproteobacteria bacterium]|nr:glycoside hydrolase family 3 C-terminal domain-containing protein [Deltaproteobacteria bacterium]